MVLIKPESFGLSAGTFHGACSPIRVENRPSTTRRESVNENRTV